MQGSSLISATPLIFLQFLLTEAKSSNRDIQQLLTHADIPHNADALIRGEIKNITIEEYCRFFRTLANTWQQQASFSNGFIPADSNTLRHMGYSLVNSNTLAEAVEQVTNFFSMFSELNQANEIRKNDQEVYFALKRVSKNNSKSVLPAELNGLSTLHRIFSWLIGEYIPLIEVGLYGESAEALNSIDLSLVFHCPIETGMSSSYIRFPVSFLERQVVQTVESLEEFIPIAPYILATLSDPKESLSERIHGLLGDELSRDLPSIEHISEIFHTSSTTLRRHLRQENTSYQQIKNDRRRDLAIKLLTENKPNIDSIAEKVGFSDANTFRRAFKKWTGMSPSDFREQQTTREEKEAENI